MDIVAAVKADIAVVGGGAAGIAAAVSAARLGHSVVLLERSGQLGGNAVNAAVGTICGLSPVGQRSIALNGFALEFVKQMQALSDGEREASRSQLLCLSSGGLPYFPYEVPTFLRVSNKLLAVAGVVPWLFTVPTAITFGSDRESCIITHNGFSFSSLSCKAVIDCSGNAVVSQIAGLPVYRHRRQCDALVGKVLGKIFLQESDSSLIDGDCVSRHEQLLGCFLHKELTRLQRMGLLRSDTSVSGGIVPISIVPGSVRADGFQLKLGSLHAIDGSDLARAKQDMQLREEFFEIVEALRAHVPECCDFRVDWLASQVGERTGMCGVGRGCLSGARVRSGVREQSEVVAGYWPIEVWESMNTCDPIGCSESPRRYRGSLRPRIEYINNGGQYSITRDMLQSETVPNLFFAGRTISADADGISSARVLGTSFATGEAAACLASETISESLSRNGARVRHLGDGVEL